MLQSQINYIKSGIAKLPNFDGQVVRQVSNYAKFETMQIGDIISERGFASSSISDDPKNDTFKSRKIRLIIQSKTGKKLIGLLIIHLKTK